MGFLLVLISIALNDPEGLNDFNALRDPIKLFRDSLCERR